MHIIFFSYIGAIESIASTIHFEGETSFYGHVNVESALYVSESRLYAHNDIIFSNNFAGGKGGALFLDQSEFVCHKNCTFTGNEAQSGGAIHAINSIITIGSDWNKCKQKNQNSLLSFVSNSANEGGAIYLEVNSKLRAPRRIGCTYELVLDNNVAKFNGGAIFVNDYTNTCQHSTCFIQAPSIYSNVWNGCIKINSTSGNTTIYGGLLDRCIAKRKYSDLYVLSGITYMKNVTDITRIEDVI